MRFRFSVLPICLLALMLLCLIMPDEHVSNQAYVRKFACSRCTITLTLSRREWSVRADGFTSQPKAIWWR